MFVTAAMTSVGYRPRIRMYFFTGLTSKKGGGDSINKKKMACYLQDSLSGSTQGVLLIAPVVGEVLSQDPVHVIIMTDTSSSMKVPVEHAADGHKVSRHTICMDLIRDIAHLIVRRGNEDDKISVVGFSSLIQPWAEAISVGTFVDSMDLLLPDRPCGRGTDIGLSLQYTSVPVLTFAKDLPQRVIILHLTDGEATQGMTSTKEMTSAQRAANMLITRQTGTEPFVIAIAISSGACFNVPLAIAQSAGDRGFAKHVLDTALADMAGDIGALLTTAINGRDVEGRFTCLPSRRINVSRDGITALPLPMRPRELVGLPGSIQLIDHVNCGPIVRLFDEDRLLRFFADHGPEVALDINLAQVPMQYIPVVVKKMVRAEQIRQCLRDKLPAPASETLFEMSSQCSEEATTSSSQFVRSYHGRYKKKHRTI
jgi:hypothetical protein